MKTIGKNLNNIDGHKSIYINNTSGDDSEDEMSSNGENIKIVPGNKMYSRVTATDVDSRNKKTIHGGSSNKNSITPQYEDIKTSELNGASLPGKVFGSLRYHSNNPICNENSPDEIGRTVPIRRGGDRIHIFSSSMCRDISEVLLNDKLNCGSAQIHLQYTEDENRTKYVSTSKNI